MDYIAEDVLLQVESKYEPALAKSRENRAIVGASLGGITSFWTALRHPDVFRNVGAKSASFWIDNSVFENSRRVNVMLRGKGFRAKYGERGTGHNWTSRRDRLAEAFVVLMN